MPKDDPDPTDPLSLEGVQVDDPRGESVGLMAECFAAEFLALGMSRDEVLDIFRSASYRLPHSAWQALGEVRIYTLVAELAAARQRRRETTIGSRGGIHV